MKQANTLYLFLISMVSAMGGLLFGYDWVVIGGAKIFYEPFFGIEADTFARGWAMSSALIGCIVGALLSGAWSDKYGRKPMLIVAAALFCISAYGTGAVDSFAWFIAYRILGGLGIGVASNVSPIYIAEVSPASMRGRFVSLNQLAIVLGILGAQIANLCIGNAFSQGDAVLNAESCEWAWRWMFWAELVPAGAFFILAFIIPESPRWLAINKHGEEAKAIFQKIAGERHAEGELQSLQAVSVSDKVDFKILLHPSHRRVLMIGISLAVLQQWCGINVIFNYAHEIFSSAGYAVSDVLMNIVITGITNVVFTFVAIFTMDRWGRKTLLHVGLAGLALIYLLLGGMYFLGSSGPAMLLLVVLAIACYAMSLAPTTWVVLSEVFPARMRGAAMAVATFFLWAACFVLTYTFPMLNELLGASGTFWTYGAICFAGFLFVKTQVPETKGQSLEEIERRMVKD